MLEPIYIGVAATKEPWSQALRAYVRDHSQGAEVEVIMDRAGLRSRIQELDVLVLDDIMRTFSAEDISRVRDAGARVIGLSDPRGGMGTQYLSNLGSDHVLPASTPAAELLALIYQVAIPRDGRQAAGMRLPALPNARPAKKKRRGLFTAWTKVTGGPGLTECVIAAAEHLAKRGRVLVVEAEELTPVMVSRLLRSPEGGLPWALSRARQGSPAFPEGLSGARDDGTKPVGHFDVICTAPGAQQAVGSSQLEKVLSEALANYDHVLVEVGGLPVHPSGRDRIGAGSWVLQAADAVAVLTGADPEGAARLVQWKAAAAGAGVSCECWAAFGRARRSRYERDHLRALIEANTGQRPFAGVRFLPEDPAVARSRWNADIVARGPWVGAVRELTAAVVSSALAARAGVEEPIDLRASLAPGVISTPRTARAVK